MTTPDTLKAVFAELDDAIARRLDLTVGWNMLRGLKEAGASQDEVETRKRTRPFRRDCRSVGFRVGPVLAREPDPALI